jgi:xylulokinase
VAIGWSDAMAGMLGTGALADAGLAFDIAGTSEIVGLTAKGEPPYSDGLLIAPVLDTDLHIIYGPTQTSGGALQWFVDAFCSEEERNSLPALLLEADRATEDMIFLPYLEGERAPIWNPHVRGAFHRISSTHTKGHFLRAVLEGVAFSIRHVLDIAQKAIGASSSGLLLSMGGAALPAWNQIKADVLGIQVQPTAVPDAGTLGAAMLAALAAQEFEDIRSVSRAMVRLADPVDPRPDAHCHYDELYRDYLRMSDFVRRLDHVGASSVELPRHMT